MNNTYCDECLNIAYDNIGSDYQSQVEMLSTIGDMIEDHICEAKDNVDTNCNCLCNTGHI